MSTIDNVEHKLTATVNDNNFDEKFREQLRTIAANGVLSMAIALGTRLGLFDALARVADAKRPQTAAVVADNAKCKQRYVQEWLCTMACGSIIEVDESGQKFWIRNERISDLTNADPFVMCAYQQMLPMFGCVFEQILNVFRLDGPLGMDYSSYVDFYALSNKMSQSMHRKNLIDGFLPLTGGLDKLLESGLTALDVGCGGGFHVQYFASHFPNSHFIGIDIGEDAIKTAKNQSTINEHSKDVLSNVEFIVCNGESMPNVWTNRFDWVSLFDSCHDQQRPDLTLKEVKRVLKPGGLLTMIDINGTSNAFNDRETAGLAAAQGYGISLFHCLPVGNNSPDALGLGSMWGRKRAEKLLHDAGFDTVKVVATPFSTINILYMCRKNEE